MKLQKILLAMVTCSSIPFIFALSSAQAADFTFNAKFSNGYSAKGSFTTKSGTPAFFSEVNPNFPSAPFTTKFLESTSLSIFDSTNKLLQSGSNVSNGISSDPYLRLDYDGSLPNNLPALNISTETPTQNPYYYIANNVNPTATEYVTPGSTNYNLFSYDRTTDKDTFLGDTTSIKVSAVPEPSSAISLLALATFGFGLAFKRRLNHKTKSNCLVTNNL